MIIVSQKEKDDISRILFQLLCNNSYCKKDDGDISKLPSIKFNFQSLVLEVKPIEYLYIGENDYWSLRIGSIEEVNTRGICTKYKYGLGGYRIGSINPTFKFKAD